MPDSRLSPSEKPAVASQRPPLENVFSLIVVLVILYVAKSVLIPITLAVILSFLVAPLVRIVHRTGLGNTFSVLLAVGVLAAAMLAIAGVMLAQVGHLAAGLPQYQENMRSKVATIESMTVGRVSSVMMEAGRVIHELTDDARPSSSTAAPSAPSLLSRLEGRAIVPVEIHEPEPTAMQVTRGFLGTVLGPLEMAGIVFVVLMFVLMDQEALRDRLIRLAGSKDLRRTTAAMNDAAERLSRYFVSQFAVNAGVGTVVGIGLALLGVPSATLLGILTMVMRFVPYVGAWAAALIAGVLAAAVDPGWSLMTMTMIMYAVVELLAGQVVEPLLYGHSTGMSPLSVVLAAIFWGWIWGPIGLILSTPLTLCLVVLGRYAAPLRFLEILLGDAPALTMHQKFYQRILAGDADEIIERGRLFLKTKSFAEYCDKVVMPALQLASTDSSVGVISVSQQKRAGDTVVRVIETLSSNTHKRSFRRQRSPVLSGTDFSAARILRERRELQTGPYQGPLDMAPGSVILCVGLGSQLDALATEILVRVLRQQNLDVRHLSLDDLKATRPPGAVAESVGEVCIVSVDPAAVRDKGGVVVAQIRRELGHAAIVSVFLPAFFAEMRELLVPAEGVDHAADSFTNVVHYTLERRAAQQKDISDQSDT